MMDRQKHLPVFGIGPVYAAFSALFTVMVCLVERVHLIPNLRFTGSGAILKIVAATCFLIAAMLWLNALFVQKIDHHIRNNELVTTGAYAWVRNPIYSAIMLIMWAFLAWTGNLCLLLLFPLYPLFLTLLLKHTEEKWLAEQYGQEYLLYCQQVNRCIPWFPRCKIPKTHRIGGHHE